MNIFEIPEALFKGFAKQYGLGEEYHDETSCGPFLLAQLNENKSGFSGAVGFKDSSDKISITRIFALWDGKMVGLEPVFTLIVSAEKIGFGADGLGIWGKENIIGKFPKGIDFRHKKAARMMRKIYDYIMMFEEASSTLANKEAGGGPGGLKTKKWAILKKPFFFFLGKGVLPPIIRRNFF